MSLKDAIFSDIDNVFFQLNDFAETVVFDGKEIPVIKDSQTLNEKTDLYAMGLSQGEELRYVRAADMPRRPNRGDQLTEDGKQWYIRHVVDNYGVYELRIGRDVIYD